jgi:hypothetical protein
MAPERWRHIEQLYDEALDRPAAARSVWFHEACSGDEDLQQEVARLLWQSDSEDFLGEAPPSVGAALIDERRRLFWRISASAPSIFRRCSVVWARFYRARDARLKRATHDRPTETTRLSVTPPSLPGVECQWWGRSAGLSPDGRLVAYVANNGPRTQLYVRALDAFDSRPLGWHRRRALPVVFLRWTIGRFLCGRQVAADFPRRRSARAVCDVPITDQGRDLGPDGTIVYDTLDHPDCCGCQQTAVSGAPDESRPTGLPVAAVGDRRRGPARQVRARRSALICHRRVLLRAVNYISRQINCRRAEHRYEGGIY